MKSLDEVIKKIEKQWVCPSSDEADEYCELYEVRDDALHYLKEYRDDKENFSEAISNCGKALNKYIMDINALAQQEENSPLTWDELKQMEGKPVWVEINGYTDARTICGFDCTTEYFPTKEWMLVEEICHNSLARLKRINGRVFMAWKRIRATAWQAYRKEQK